MNKKEGHSTLQNVILCSFSNYSILEHLFHNVLGIEKNSIWDVKLQSPRLRLKLT